MADVVTFFMAGIIIPAEANPYNDEAFMYMLEPGEKTTVPAVYVIVPPTKMPILDPIVLVPVVFI